MLYAMATRDIDERAAAPYTNLSSRSAHVFGGCGSTWSSNRRWQCMARAHTTLHPLLECYCPYGLARRRDQIARWLLLQWEVSRWRFESNSFHPPRRISRTCQGAVPDSKLAIKDIEENTAHSQSEAMELTTTAGTLLSHCSQSHLTKIIGYNFYIWLHLWDFLIVNLFQTSLKQYLLEVKELTERGGEHTLSHYWHKTIPPYYWEVNVPRYIVDIRSFLCFIFHPSSLSGWGCNRDNPAQSSHTGCWSIKTQELSGYFSGVLLQDHVRVFRLRTCSTSRLFRDY